MGRDRAEPRFFFGVRVVTARGTLSGYVTSGGAQGIICGTGNLNRDQPYAR